jgi:multidrug efflux pump
MTSFAFIAGVVPLVIAHGAGAEMRRVMGIAVFSGMLGVTFFGLLFTPVFYVLIRGLVSKRVPHRNAPSDDDVKPFRIPERLRAIGGEGASHA